jgi:hypothetical protein
VEGLVTVKVSVKGNIKRRFIVNGREYSSVEEMPENIRRAYGQALWNTGHQGYGNYPEAPQTRIVFNGREYGSVDDMPDEVRRLFAAAMTTAEAQGKIELGVTTARQPVSVPLERGGSASTPSPSMEPIEVGGGSTSWLSKLVTVGIVLLLLLGAIYYLSRALLGR